MNLSKNNNEQKNSPTFWKLFWLFFKISIFSFGGGNAIFPMIKNYCVDKNKWITESDIDDILIISNSLPGPSAVEGICYVAYLLLKSKWKAGVVTMLSLLPHSLLFFIIFMLGIKFLPINYLRVIYVAVVPVIIALLIYMTIRYIKIEKNGISITIHWLIFILTLSFSIFVPVPWCMPIFIICFVALCLIFYNMYKKRKKEKDKK